MNKPFYKGRLSINKEKSSPYWMVTFQGPDGKMKRRSTKVPVNGGEFEGDRITAKLAERIAYQRGVQIACAEAEEYQVHNNVSVRAWCDGFVGRKAALVSEQTAYNARTACKHFYEYLGARANAPLRLITKADIKGFVAARRELVRQKTVYKDMSVLSQAFADAVDAEVIDRNPCAGVSIPPDRAGEKLHKEAFTLDEIRYMIEHFPPLWSSAVRCSFETYGQRLGDILRLNWNQFDWERRIVRFDTGKTGRWMDQPMREGFYQWALARWKEAGEPADELLHAPLLALGDGASYQFGLLLRTHGIGVVHGAAGGRRRRMNSKSFHSIRATAATLLQASGVSQGLAMELVGHDSSAVHSVYIRPSADQLRSAAESLPELLP